MNKTVAICSLLVSAGLWILLSVAAPWVLSDNNRFLQGFVNHEFLGFMGVIVTITLASAANLHIELNKCEDRVAKPVFTQTKSDVRHSAMLLVAMLILSLLVVIAKPLINCGAVGESIMNGAAVMIIIVSILTLIDLTLAAFSLETTPR